MKIALVSLDQCWENKEANKNLVHKEVELIAPYLPDLIIFPEMTLTGFTMKSEEFSEDFASSPSVKFFSEVAKSVNSAIAFGLIVKEQKGCTNNLVVVDKQGNVLNRYQKIHPFSYSGEDKYYLSGNELKVVDINNTPFALTICYDLRFPELYQGLSKKAPCIINIANWPQRRVAHWHALSLARAIENQVFMIGVNRTGVDGNNLFYEKSSSIISPNGDYIDCEAISPVTDLYSVDPEIVTSTRISFPVKIDRKTKLYKEII